MTKLAESEVRQSYFAHLSIGGGAQQLQHHLVQVSRLAESHAARIGLAPAGALIGLLHDLGKYSSQFQTYLKTITLQQDTEAEKLERGSVDHSTAGAQFIWRALQPRGPRQQVAAEILAVCIASHHSGLIDCVSPEGENKFGARMGKEDVRSNFLESNTNAELPVTGRRTQLLDNPETVDGLLKIVESICCHDAPEILRRFNVGLLTRLLFSVLIDADRTDTADSENVVAAALRQHARYIEWPMLINRLDRKLETFQSLTPVDVLRKKVSEACLLASSRPRGVFTLTVPTGGGKTLASLRFALHHAQKWGLERIIYVSPYTSIIDQNAEAVRRILEPAGTPPSSVVLEHHSNLTPNQQTWRNKILSENWDAPVVFTTAVQLLESLFGSGTRAVRRMHRLANSVVILDEIQTLPVRCVHLFNNAVNFFAEQCGSTVVLCTATQPLLHRVDQNKGAIRLAEDAEIMPDVQKLFAAVQRHETHDSRKPGGWQYSEVAQLAVDEAKSAGSCLVVVNTKREARAIHADCQSIAQGFPVFHLSAAMCPAHRMDILEEVKRLLSQPAPVICVSTQLIEAGVDISFAAAIRAIAGFDSIAQTAGRCNRHGESRILGRIHVVNIAGELPTQLTDIRKAQDAAHRVLDENRTRGNRLIDLSDPAMIEQYFHYYFFDRRNEMDYPVDPRHAGRNDTLLNMLAQNSQAVSASQSPPGYLRQAFMTAAKAFQAIDAAARGVIVPYNAEACEVINDLCAMHHPDQSFALLRRAQRFTVNTFPHVLKTLQDKHAVREVQEGAGILYLDQKYYTKDFGLDIEGQSEMEFQNA